jgi:hypothetical protein
MPIYYFHLGIDGRMLPDEEGIELRDRAAARAEASAVMRELAPAKDGDKPRSWFLRIADEEGPFLHLPIDRPALEVVGSSGRYEAPESRSSHAPAPTRAVPDAPSFPSAAVLIQKVLEQRKRTAHLLEQNRQLQVALASQLRLSEKIRGQAMNILLACAGRPAARPLTALQ